ncbi:hypothetical protein ACKWTF_013333 [Chironomus riparius]
MIENKACQGPNLQKKRIVAPFSMSAYQKNTMVFPPSKINVYEERMTYTSKFRVLYLRGDIPCVRSYCKKDEGSFISWKVDSLRDLDYSYYLPIFFDGLCEAAFPYNFIARYAIHDLLNAASDKILPVIPKLIIPIKNALNTKNCDIIMATLRIIHHMCICDPCVAEALVPFYRQLLPTFNLFRDFNSKLSGGIDYDRSGRVGDVIDETLSVLEAYGGPDAFINIKYAILNNVIGHVPVA